MIHNSGRVLSVSVFKSGTASNILPDYCLLEGTLRTHTDETAAYIKKRMEEIVNNAAGQAGGKCRLAFEAGLRTVVSDSSIACKVCEAALHAGANACYLEKPLMYAEDFSHYLTKKYSTKSFAVNLQLSSMPVYIIVKNTVLFH